MKAFFAKHKKLILSILFTAACLLIWRIGVHIRLPFVQYNNQTATDSNIFGFLDIFTGGALQSFSIVALGISPYINASIIVELLQMDIIPQFKEWSEEGETGKEETSENETSEEESSKAEKSSESEESEEAVSEASSEEESK